MERNNTFFVPETDRSLGNNFQHFISKHGWKNCSHSYGKSSLQLQLWVDSWICATSMDSIFFFYTRNKVFFWVIFQVKTFACARQGYWKWLAHPMSVCAVTDLLKWQIYEARKHQGMREVLPEASPLPSPCGHPGSADKRAANHRTGPS